MGLKSRPNLNLSLQPLRSYYVLLLGLAGIFSIIGFIYQLDLKTLYTEAIDNDWANYILIIPFIFGYLLYSKRKVLSAMMGVSRIDSSSLLTGLALFAIAFLLYFYGSYTLFTSFIHIASMCIFLFGCFFVTFGKKIVRILIFPLAYLALITPPPLEAFYIAGETLVNLTMALAGKMLLLVNLPVTLFENQIVLMAANGEPLLFSVDVPCSGIYSLLAFFPFALFLTYISTGKLWKRLLLLPVGMILVYSLNVLRVFLIVAIGYYSGSDLAVTVFHTLGGLVLIFIGTILLVIIGEKLLKLSLGSQKNSSCQHATADNWKLGYCKICGALKTSSLKGLTRKIIPGILLALVFSAVFQMMAVPVIEIGNEKASLSMHSSQGSEIVNVMPNVSDWHSSYLDRVRDYEQMTGEDAVFWFMYSRSSSTLGKAYPWLYTMLEISSSNYAHGVSGWYVCMPTQGYTMKVYEPVVLQQSPAVIGWYIVLEESNPNSAVGRIAIVAWTQRMSLFINSNSTGTSYETKTVGVSVVAYPNSLYSIGYLSNPADYSSIKGQLMDVASGIFESWNPIKTGSIFVGVANYLLLNSILLLPISFMVGTVSFGSHILRQDSGRRKFRQKLRQLSSEDQRFLSVVSRLERGGKPATPSRISEEISLDLDQTCDALQRFESAGLIFKDYTVQGDEVRVTWKSTP